MRFRLGQAEAIVARARAQGRVVAEFGAGKVANPCHIPGPLTLTLPLPPHELSQNARCHWSKKSAATKAYRLRTEVECGSRGERYRAATVRIQWFTKTKMHPDPMNAMGSLKAAFDGVTDSGFLADDRELYPDDIQFTKDASNPRVVLTFSAR